MPGLLIVGAGGHGKVVADTAYEMGKWRKIAFLDDRYLTLKSLLRWPILGSIAQAPLLVSEYSEAVVAIGNNSLRLALLQHFRKIGFDLPAILHPAAFISQFAKIGTGSVVFAQAAVNAGAQIGSASIVNTGAVIDHDCFIGDGVHISPGARLAGEVKIGNYSWVGIGASVVQRISIGENVMVGAGSAIIASIPNNTTVVGVPGRIIKGTG